MPQTYLNITRKGYQNDINMEAEIEQVVMSFSKSFLIHLRPDVVKDRTLGRLAR